jgi:hypothetical protein
MSLAVQRESRQANEAGRPEEGAGGEGAREVPSNPQRDEFRSRFYSQSRAEALDALGEDVAEYLGLKESLSEDLEPRPGYETLLVDQMGETLWEMRRAQRMREGLAVRRLQGRLPGENLLATTLAARAIESLEPFERLQTALSRRDGGPSAEEIQAFAKARQDDSSPETQEFLRLLQSLLKPLEEGERKAALRQARKHCPS